MTGRGETHPQMTTRSQATAAEQETEEQYEEGHNPQDPHEGYPSGEGATPGAPPYPSHAYYQPYDFDHDPKAQNCFQALQAQIINLQTQLQQAPQPNPTPATEKVTVYKSTKLPAHGYIPNFTGERLGVSGVISIQAYVRIIERNTRAPHWSGEQKILLALKYLSGRAQTRLNNSCNYNPNDWEIFK